MTRAPLVLVCAALALVDGARSVAAPSPPAPVLLVTEPAALAALEDAGLRAGAVAFATPAARDNAALSHDRAYLDVVDTLGRDLRELYRKDRAWGPGMRFTHRGFDRRWLVSPDTRWQLTAVVNRVDRRAFLPGTCGEARFIYRLAYTAHTRSGAFSSRLPATLNVVFRLPADHAGCRQVLARFAAPLAVDDARALASKDALLAVEINAQTARWPSTVRPDLGGHADYVLRVFHPKGGRLVEAPLEDTPDVDKLMKSPALKAELTAFLRGHLDDVDRGTLVVPEKFLARRAVSVTPRGLARPQNRPWTRLLDARTLKALGPLPAASTIATPAALVRRLDGLTCMGCHQSRSLAGFHIVGEERAGGSVDGVAVGISPHLEEDLPRRRAYADAVAAGGAALERRAPPEHELARGGFGDSCGLGDAGFAAWSCASGLHCTAVDDDVVGQCMPDAPAPGSACRPGVVSFTRDRIARSTNVACGGGVCEGVDVGFPGGMCAASCGDSASHARCGGIAVLGPFNACLARGELFSSCAQHVTPAALRACGPHDPCRPDYICAGGGVCLPPYFVLQMRVDGHPALAR